MRNNFGAYVFLILESGFDIRIYKIRRDYFGLWEFEDVRGEKIEREKESVELNGLVMWGLFFLLVDCCKIFEVKL